MEMVTVFTSFNVIDADLVWSRLDAAAFHPIITNELSALSMGGYTLAAGGVLIQVPSDEAERAKEFLASPDDAPTA